MIPVPALYLPPLIAEPPKAGRPKNKLWTFVNRDSFSGKNICPGCGETIRDRLRDIRSHFIRCPQVHDVPKQMAKKQAIELDTIRSIRKYGPNLNRRFTQGPQNPLIQQPNAPSRPVLFICGDNNQVGDNFEQVNMDVEARGGSMESKESNERARWNFGARLQEQIKHQALTFAIRGQHNFNTFQTDEWKSLFESILEFVRVTGGPPPLPDSRQFSKSLLPARVKMMNIKIRQIVVECRYVQVLVDETTKEHVRRIITMINVGHLFCFDIEAGGFDCSALALFDSHSQLLDPLCDDGVVYDVNTCDSCSKMKSFREMVKRKYSNYANGCYIHVVVNSSKRLEACEWIQDVLSIVSHIHNKVMNTKLYVCLRDYYGKERIPRAVSNNTLEWGSSCNKLKWFMDHSTALYSIMDEHPHHFNEAALGMFYGHSNICLLYGAFCYLSPVRLMMKLLQRSNVNLSDCLAIHYMILRTYDYQLVKDDYTDALKKMWLHKDDETLDLSNEVVNDLWIRNIAPLFFKSNDALCTAGSLFIGGNSYHCLSHPVQVLDHDHEVVEQESDSNELEEKDEDCSMRNANVAEGKGHYLLFDKARNVYWAAGEEEHQLVIDNFLKYYRRSWINLTYIPMISVSFLVDIRFRNVPIYVEHYTDAHGYLLTVFGRNNNHQVMRTIQEFRDQHGLYSQGLFDTSYMDSKMIADLDSTQCWKSLKHIGDRSVASQLLTEMASLFARILKYTGHQGGLESFIKQFANVTSHNREHKGILTKEQEVALRHNEDILRKHYGLKY